LDADHVAALLEEIRDQLRLVAEENDSLERKLDEQGAKLDRIDERLSRVEGDVSVLKMKMERMEGDVSALKTEMERKSKRTPTKRRPKK
jgi:predicted nuclease with TOPRIM domain